MLKFNLTSLKNRKYLCSGYAYYRELKNMCQIEHTRHRCIENFLSNLIAGIIAYQFFPKKPTLNLEIIDNKALRNFT